MDFLFTVLQRFTQEVHEASTQKCDIENIDPIYNKK